MSLYLSSTVTFHKNELKTAVISKTDDNRFKVEVSIDHQKEVLSNKVESTADCDLLQIGLYDKSDKLIIIENACLKKGINQLSFATDQQISKAVLDPNMITIEKNLDDNELLIEEE
ncbi:hypothetical protein [Ekhidna sp.]